eukprot:6016829-Amphidinium_carterae.1
MVGIAQVIMFWNYEMNAWQNAIVMEEAGMKTGFRWRLMIKNSAYDPVKDGISNREGPGEESVLRYLSTGNCGPSRFKTTSFEEDTQRLKGYFRSRHSFIMDALSGAKIDLKDCALPVLHVQVDRSADGRLKSTSDGSGGKSGGVAPSRSSSQGGSQRVTRAASLGMNLRQSLRKPPPGTDPRTPKFPK